MRTRFLMYNCLDQEIFVSTVKDSSEKKEAKSFQKTRFSYRLRL